MKIFGIGLNKTGTTTLGECLATLGFRHISCRPDLVKALQSGDMAAVWEVADTADAFEDWPWPLIYRDAHGRYGHDARFILTVRASAAGWLDSLKRHSLRTPPKGHLRTLVYGYDYPHGLEAQHLAMYERHNEAVRSFFADKPGKLLEVCWERGDGWTELCAFLHRREPDAPFPHANAGTGQEDDVKPAIREANEQNIARQLARLRQL